MPINAADVRWCYKNLLNRLPESDDVISAWLSNASDWQSLVKLFIGTKEFRDITNMTSVHEFNVLLYNKTKHDFLFPAPLSNAYVLDQYSLNDYESDECKAIKDHLSAGQNCIDLGARHGFMTCVMAKSVGAAGRVYSFEPSVGTDILLQAKTANDFEQVQLIRKAAGDYTGKIRFSTENAQFSAEGGDDEVEITRLDDIKDTFVRPISFIKMDIEGAEYRALQGAEILIRSDRPTILMELYDEQQRAVSGCTVKQLIELMRSWSYKIVGLDGETVSDATIDEHVRIGRIFNVVFVPDAASDRSPRLHVVEYSGTEVVSYAQNNEDVLYHRAFKGKKDGTFIDIGAGHPAAENVTMWLSTRGWRGVNVEPNPIFFGELENYRPLDTNLNVGVSDAPGNLTYYQVVQNDLGHGWGLSSFDPAAVKLAESQGFTVNRMLIPVVTLNDIVAQHYPSGFDLLKIDVEGLEQRIITSTDWNAVRPRLICVEAVEPNSARPTWPLWEDALLRGGYRFAAFDGANCYYCQQDDTEMLGQLSAPVCCNDPHRRATDADIHTVLGLEPPHAN